MEMYGNVRTSHSIPRPVEQMLTLKKTRRITSCCLLHHFLSMAAQASSEQDRPKPGTYSLSLHAMGTMGFHGISWAQ